VWIPDETLNDNPSSESEDEDYSPGESEDESEDFEEEEDETPTIHLPRGSTVSVKLHIHTVVPSKAELLIDGSESEDSDSESEEERMPKGRRHTKDSPLLALNDDESEYFEHLSRSKKKEMVDKMRSVSGLVDAGDVPFKFRVLDLNIADSTKASVIKKIDLLSDIGMDGEGYKLRSWIESFLRIPFGKHVPLPVKLSDGAEPCARFLADTSATLDKAVYGMPTAKSQIMQILAQWISSPASIGNVIALKGPMGTGKTSFAKNGVAKVLQRPFEFFSLGGASDSANFVGHSYTYEGSTWGRIVDALMNARCMNPVLYFDEVDKISTTPHGDEIASMLIHLTDRTQNSHFHDRYFSGVDFDLSQCLFVFSFNDETKIHPILRDRMQVISCSGYSALEKKSILTQYVCPQVIERIRLTDQLTLSDDAMRFLISEYSSEEEGVRTLIRSVETLVTRINLLRIADETTAKTYPFYQKIVLPLTVDVNLTRHILQDTGVPKNEAWRSLYN
jgi:ATP-dependent Lon protease